MYISKEIHLDGIFTNMTTKDNNFELLSADKINIVDKDGKSIDDKELNNKYNAFTFNGDKREYLVVNSDGLKIMNMDYEEGNEISINKQVIDPFEINDIFYVDNKILIASEDRVFSLDYSGNYLKNEVNISDFFTTKMIMENCQQIIQKVPNDFLFTAVGSDGVYKYVAYNKNNSCFLAKLSNNGTKIEELFIGDNVNINSIVFDDGLYLNGIKDNNGVIYEISSTDYSVQSIINSLVELIDKISNSEESIASIVLAEANKVNRIIETTTDVDKILEVNESILLVISEAVSLEQYERSNLNDILKLVEELVKVM